MTKQEFIAFYCGEALAEYKTEFGMEINGRKRFALTCNCGDDLCLGWAMISEDCVEDHKRMYVADEGERKG